MTIKDRIVTRRDALDAMYEGLHYYGSKRTKAYPNGLKIENLTLSISPGLDQNKKVDIFPYFLKYMSKLNTFCQWQPISYFGVVVDDQHIHMLWRKPFFMPPEQMRGIWSNIVGSDSNLRNFTVKGDLTKTKDIQKLVLYIADQEEHHQKDVYYIKSEFWGKIVPKQKKDESYKPLPFYKNHEAQSQYNPETKRYEFVSVIDQKS